MDLLLHKQLYKNKKKAFDNTKPLKRYLRISIFRYSVTEKQNAIKSYLNVP